MKNHKMFLVLTFFGFGYYGRKVEPVSVMVSAETGNPVSAGL